MVIQDNNFKENAAEIFQKAPFIREIGLQLVDCGPGWCETVLRLEPWLLQQNGVAHAGILATMADHTAGAAGTTIISQDEYVLTAEFKINLLRPGDGDSLRCRAQVLKPGRVLTIVESEVHAEKGGASILVAKAMVTLVVLRKP